MNRRQVRASRYLIVLVALIGLAQLTVTAPYSRSVVTAMRKTTANFEGFLDTANCDVLSGWAADATRLNTSINVTIFDGPNQLGVVLANSLRKDVIGVTGDNGLHGFAFPVPATLKDGRPHTIKATFETSAIELSNSPRTITCQAIALPGDTAVGDFLNLDFKLNNGATSTTNKVVGITFKAIESAGSDVTVDVTNLVTHYRIRESPNNQDISLNGLPWIPITSRLGIELAVRNAAGQRYGDRRVMLQVKTAKITSNTKGDSITLDPVLKEYRVGTNSGGHPLIQFAAAQGFAFPLDHYETCAGACVTQSVADANLGSGSASVFVQGEVTSGDGALCVLGAGLLGGSRDLFCKSDNAPVPAGTCRTKVDYLLFETRSPNSFWHIKSVSVPGSTVVFHGQDRFRIKFQFDNTFGCIGPKDINVGEVVLEGPADDDFIDPANPWKNAFVRVLRPPVGTLP